MIKCCNRYNNSYNSNKIDYRYKQLKTTFPTTFRLILRTQQRYQFLIIKQSTHPKHHKLAPQHKTLTQIICIIHIKYKKVTTTITKKSR